MFKKRLESEERTMMTMVLTASLYSGVQDVHFWTFFLLFSV